MDYNPLFDRLWGADGSHPFGDPFKFEEYMNDKIVTSEPEYQYLEEEMYESIRGDYKTTIICKFNKEGYLVSHTAQCVDISEDKAIMTAMREELFNALEEERYEDARAYQEKINQLRHLTELRKPTL
jgi:hypothetical protein